MQAVADRAAIDATLLAPSFNTLSSAPKTVEFDAAHQCLVVPASRSMRVKVHLERPQVRLYSFGAPIAAQILIDVAIVNASPRFVQTALDAQDTNQTV